jgi:MFS family permease
MNRPSPMTADQRRLGQQSALRANLFTGVVTQIVLGALMMLYASDVLGYSPVRVGFIVSVAPLGMLLRFFMLRSVRESGKVPALRRSQITRMIIIGLLLAIPARWMSFPLFTLLVCGFSLANELGVNVAWQPILRDVTTTADRGSFFARMRFAFTVVTAAVTAAVPFLIGSSMKEWQYKCLLAVAMAGAANFYFWCGRIPERPAPASPEPGPDALWPHLRRILVRSPLLREPLILTLLVAFMGFPVFVLYLKEMLRIPSNLISLFVFAGTAGAALSLLLWGKVADAIGFRPMFKGLLILTLVILPLLFTLTPFPESGAGPWQARQIVTLASLLLQGFLNGALAAGIGISLTTIQHFFVHPEDVIESMTLYSGAVVLVSAVVSMVSSAFLQSVAIPQGLRLFAGQWLAWDWVKLWIVAFNLVLGLLSLRLLRRIPNSHDNREAGDFFEAVAGTLGQVVRIVPLPAAWLPRREQDPDTGEDT